VATFEKESRKFFSGVVMTFTSRGKMYPANQANFDPLIFIALIYSAYSRWMGQTFSSVLSVLCYIYHVLNVLYFSPFLSLSPSGSSRNARASLKAAESILHRLRGRTEFTLLLTLKQEQFSSGVLLSIHYGEQRYPSIHP